MVRSPSKPFSATFADYQPTLAALVRRDAATVKALQQIFYAAEDRPTLEELTSLVRFRQAVAQRTNKDSPLSPLIVETVALWLFRGLHFRPGPLWDTAQWLALQFLVGNHSSSPTRTSPQPHRNNQSNRNPRHLDELTRFLVGTATELSVTIMALHPLWWELRALIIFHTRRICDQAQTVAHAIAAGAGCIEHGVRGTAGLCNAAVARTGAWVVRQQQQHHHHHQLEKEQQEPKPKQQKRKRQHSSSSRLPSSHHELSSADQMSHFATAARRATMQARTTTVDCVDTLLHYSDAGLEQAQQAHYFVNTPPWMQAAGVVTAASVGAVVVVGEGISHATRTVLSTTAAVTADVVAQRYGTTAGQAVRDGTAAVGNAWLAVRAALTLVSPATAVAKHGCKQHLRQCQTLASRTEDTVDTVASDALFENAWGDF